MNAEVFQLCSRLELRPASWLPRPQTSAAAGQRQPTETHTYVSENKKLLMTASNFNSIPHAQHTLQAWSQGLQFMNDVQGFRTIHDATDAGPRVGQQAWVAHVLEQYPDAKNKVFFAMLSPFKELHGDIRGICLVTPYGNFLSVSEIAVKEEITAPLLREILTGEALKEPLIQDN